MNRLIIVMSDDNENSKGFIDGTKTTFLMFTDELYDIKDS